MASYTKFSSEKSNRIQDSIFKVQGKKFSRGSWWWWFWLFFFNDSEKPRQLMILWSTKKDRELECNDLKIRLNHKLAERSSRKIMDGAVAAWYFDGKKMHHNFLLEQVPLVFSENSLATGSGHAEFAKNKNGYSVKIGKNIAFEISLREKNLFTMPTHDSKKIFGFNYELLRMNKLDLKGTVNGKKIKGSAYFQRVFLDAPAMPWYWGVFHFKKGAVLSYFKPHIGKYFGEVSIKKDIAFFYKGKLHKMKNLKIKKKLKNGLPVFWVSGETKGEKINFKAEAYSDSWWKFRKKVFGILPVRSTFVWHEYPSVIRNFELTDKKTGKKITEKNIGLGIGNAEQSHGILI